MLSATSNWTGLKPQRLEVNYPLVMTNIAIEAMAIEIVDLPMKSMVTFHRFWPGQLGHIQNHQPENV